MNTEIKTSRLLLRQFKESDYDDLFEFLSQLENDEFEGYAGINYENGGKHLAERLGSTEYYAVELLASGKVIGNIYCGNRDFQTKEVGYIINREYQRRGYAKEALEAVVSAAFQAGVHRVYAECDSRNTCSWRLLEKLGFRREACFRQNIYFHTDAADALKWKDTYVYAMLTDDLADGGYSIEQSNKRTIDSATLSFWDRCHSEPVFSTYHQMETNGHWNRNITGWTV